MSAAAAAASAPDRTRPLAMLHSNTAKFKSAAASRTRRTARTSSAVSITTMGVEESIRILRRSRTSAMIRQAYRMKIPYVLRVEVSFRRKLPRGTSAGTIRRRRSRQNPLNLLPQQSKELCWRREAGEDLRQILVTQMLIQGFTEHGSEVGREREVAAFVQLRGIESGPAAVHLSALNGPAENEHDIRMSVIGAAVSIFPCRAAEFGHGHDDRVFGKIAEINPESAQGLRKLAQHVRDLALGAAFIDVMVPSADVGKRDLDPEIGFDQLRELLEAVAKSAAWIIGAGHGSVLRRIGGM